MADSILKTKNWQKTSQKIEDIHLGSPSLILTKGLLYRFERVKEFINFKNSKVLDIGCGIGAFLEKFKNEGADVYGIDIDKDKINIAKEKFYNVFVSPAEKLNFNNNFFDVIFLHEVLEHVDDDVKTINEAFRVLKKGGKIIIFTPNRLWPFETHGIYLFGKYIFGNIHLVNYLPSFIFKKLTPHVRNYTKKDLLKVFQNQNYIQIYYNRVFPGFDGLANRIPLIGKLIKQLFQFLNKTPLSIFGI